MLNPVRTYVIDIGLCVASNPVRSWHVDESPTSLLGAFLLFMIGLASCLGARRRYSIDYSV
jgi:hypothetical protein